MVGRAERQLSGTVGSAVPESALLSIGQVLARLNEDFPELTNSKLRFLEEQGLVSPQRTKSGYRKFCPADVERLRLILSLQRDHYLPLKVIRGYLDDVDAGATPVFPGGAPSIHPGVKRYSRAELVSESGASAALLTEAIAAGVIAAGESFGEDSLVLLRALDALARTGIDPRHLRGLRAQVSREAGLIERAVTTLASRSDAASRARAVTLAAETAAQFELVRSTLLREALGSLNE